MRNVAAYAGVSIATVSKVMQGAPTVLPENVTKVQNAIEALGYRINPLGAELRRGRRNLVGVIVPTFEEPLIARLLVRLELEVERRGHVLFVGCSQGSEARETDIAVRMLDWRVAGVIVKPVKGQKSPAALLLEDAAMPAVFVQARNALLRFDTVIFGINPDIAELAAASVDMLFARMEAPDEHPTIRISRPTDDSSG
ncbi:regulatory protein, lacI family [Kaistia soli DSM 19436]|uniref:Regulatory protein, lacI family n=2 Tax=Kaistia TaxID=166953 RepID=A0A1M5I2D1_9HYPH|nr:regulatory protein, lacI family [Kaistia soli DSM 19436]